MTEKVVQTIVYVMSLSVIVSGVTITFQAQLERQMRFKPIAFAQIISRILSATVGVTMATSGYGVWSLVFMNVASEFIYTCIIIFSVNRSPSFSFRIKHIKKIFNFSAYLTLTQLIFHSQRRLEIFIVAYLMGSHLGGIYSQTHAFLKQPVKLINGSVASVLFSAFSSISGDKIRLKNLYLKLTQTFVMIYIPISVILILYSEPFVLFILGEKWSELSQLFPVFGIIILCMSSHKSDTIVLKSLGRADLLFKMYLVYLTTSIIACIIGSEYGIYWVAINMLIVTFGLYIISTLVTIRFLKVKLTSYISEISRLIFYGMVMLILGYLVKIFLSSYLGNTFFGTFFSVFVTMFLYIGALFLKPVSACYYVSALMKSKN